MQITEYTFANITARPFLTLNDANNKWIFTDKTKHIIDVCMYREPEVIDLIQSKGATFDWFPTDERPMDLDMILKAVSFSEHDNVLCPNAHEFKDIDICLGFNEDETKPSECTLRFVADFFRERGYCVAFNKPFSNSMTVNTNHRYHSLMIEVNKHCYMNEDTHERTEGFEKLHSDLQKLYHLLLNS